ncbi:hypothetical protein [Flavobacterium cellulosilyticum]|uniref:Uncharacterized protein n=1 Tax=Flavobacterium cellulosilyticum TaxID=2541731 RepID=A0A4R5CAH4_9FLAO|nr:hypothetical protein [Flavobacterium cellulosilyticum]TDD94094.1 hypothetical protein E0F76_17540 [Flavobacterium cellulosilyticum]
MNNNFNSNLSRDNSTTIPFVSQTILDNGILLVFKNKEDKYILFSKIGRIFINKSKLSTSNKLRLSAIALMLVFLMLLYLPIDFIVFAILFVCIPILIKIHKFKWYQFNVNLLDGTLYKKRFFMNSKQDHVNMVYLVRKEIYNYNLSLDLEFVNSLKLEIIDETSKSKLAAPFFI